MTLDRIDGQAIAEVRELQREGTINMSEARQLLGLPARPETTIHLRIDASPLKEAIEALRQDVQRTIRGMHRRGLERR